MQSDVKKYMLGLLHTGHCKEMSQALICERCEPKFSKAWSEYNRLRKEKPELFTRKELEFQPSSELKEIFGQVADRVKHDKMYRDHLWKSQYGTIEEQNKEADLVNSGFYKKNSGYSKKFI